MLQEHTGLLPPLLLLLPPPLLLLIKPSALVADDFPVEHSLDCFTQFSQLDLNWWDSNCISRMVFNEGSFLFTGTAVMATMTMGNSGMAFYFTFS
jgi:hypothetical protein